MREPDMRRMLKQDARGRYVMRPLHEFTVTRVGKAVQEDLEAWSFSWDGATLRHEAGPASASGEK